MLEVLKKLNWVDAFSLFLILRMCYIAVDKGLPTEIFKLLSTLFALYLSLHYYPALGTYMRGKAEPTEILADFFDLAAFGILIAAGYFSFVILRKVFIREEGKETSSFFIRLGAVILGSARGFLCVSLILYVFLISGVGYFRKSTIDSYSGKYIVKAAPAVYDFFWNNIVSKFAAGEQHNSVVDQIKEINTQT